MASTAAAPGHSIPRTHTHWVARVMIKRYGEYAELETARRADGCVDAGDENGAAVWRRVTWAAAELANTTPNGTVLN
jgi:hypothetical protein